MFRLILLVYNVLFPVLFLLYLPFYLLKLRRRGEFRRGFGERFGLYRSSQRVRLRAIPRPVWVHAVSVGEAVAALGFIRRWQEREPDQGFVLSTTTNTGQSLARRQAPEGVVVIYYPLDWWPCVRRALAVIQPRLLVIFETEIWPTMLLTARARHIPTALVNARISDHSARGFSRFRCIFRPVLRALGVVCAQTAEDARRISVVSGDRPPIHVCGTMKFDQVPDVQGQDLGPLFDRVFGPGERLLLCGASTHSGEEDVLLRAWQDLREQHPTLKLVLVPRHIERTGEVAATCVDAGVPHHRLTAVRVAPPGEPPLTPAPVLIVNTTGELVSFLAAADVVYMGKSMAGNFGGHNLIEPAIFGKPIVFGPHMDNFREVARLFREANAALQVADETALQAALARLFAEPAERQRLGQAARALVEQQRGTMDRTIELLLTHARERARSHHRHHRHHRHEPVTAARRERSA